MPGVTYYLLGDKPLSYARFAWPKYRGALARPIELFFASSLYDDIAGLARNLNGASTTLRICGPDKSGNNAGDDERTIYGVYISRVTKHNDEISSAILYDRRWILQRRVADMDFLIRFGTDYLEGTDRKTFKAALEAYVNSIDLLSANSDANTFLLLDERKMRDGQYYSGLPLPLALSMICDAGSFDLTVFISGQFAFVDRRDVSSFGSLPGRDKYDWLNEPGWTELASVVCGRPRFVHVYYPERCCLRIEGSNPGGTVAQPIREESLQVELEQVYMSVSKTDPSKSVYYTLEELLQAYGFPTTALTDAQICRVFMTGTFEGTGIANATGDHPDPTVDQEAVIKAVKDGWRTLWRIKYPKKVQINGVPGGIGGWTDWAPGQIKIDGSTLPVAVECPWVEFAADVIDLPPGADDFRGLKTTINHASPAPFTPMWEAGDAATGIIRLHQKALQDGNFAVPGALVRDLVIKQTDGGDVGGQAMRDYAPVESEDRAKAEFATSFNIAIYLTATKRLPNNETRWHVRKIPAYPDGDVDYAEVMGSSSLTCNRDYVKAGDAEHVALSDGLGPILNDDELLIDAQNATTGWMLTNTASFAGEGIAERHQAFFNEPVLGAVDEVILEVDEEVVRTKIKVGNLADDYARQHRGYKRLADRGMVVAGKVVA